MKTYDQGWNAALARAAVDIAENRAFLAGLALAASDKGKDKEFEFAGKILGDVADMLDKLRRK